MQLLRAIKKAGMILPAVAALVVILAYMGGVFSEKISPQELPPTSRRLGNEATAAVHKIVHTERVEVVGTLRAERRTEISARDQAYGPLDAVQG